MSLEIIRKVINEWDPMELLGFCPSDEYEKEIENIFTKIIDTMNINNIVDIIFETFTNSFGSSFAYSKSDCKLIAEKIVSTK